MRILTSTLLALSLVLLGFGSAVARGQAPAVDQMVLCIGSGSVVVGIDADGRPVDPAHSCADCALHVLALAPDAQVPSASHQRDVARMALPAAQVAVVAPSRAGLHLRGPPCRV